MTAMSAPWMSRPDGKRFPISSDRGPRCATIARPPKFSTLGIPMYNYTIPFTFKAWLDRMLIPPHVIMPGAESGLLRRCAWKSGFWRRPVLSARASACSRSSVVSR